MKYFGRLLLVMVVCMAASVVVAYTGSSKDFTYASSSGAVVYRPEAQSAPAPAAYEAPKPVLILYSAQDASNAAYAGKLLDVMRYRKQEAALLDIRRTETVHYDNYSMVILASPNIETEMKDSARRLTGYVEKGGKLFWAMLQNEMGRQMQSVYKQLGIQEYGDYVDCRSLCFEEELMPGVKGMTIADEQLTDAMLHVRLQEEARVYVSSKINGRNAPVFWTFPCGEGSVGVWNGTMLSGDFFRGLAAACMNAVEGTALYPVINAKCVFIDDFPSPQYESDSDVVRKEYNRSAKEFYRDIWWPDMQMAAARYHYIYTGLFITTYNDEVNPGRFSFSAPSMMQYYGNSLLRSGHEMGAHGYNHQSLAEEGLVPEDMHYKAWKSESDMAASIRKLTEIAREMFPGVRFKTYVPPSNYLSQTGRQAVKEALPDLKTVSGVYTGEGEEGAVYVQRFEMAEDGVAEFPRVTAGMLPSPYETLAWRSALTLHGVFSHFIHPDDIFDAERGKGQNWESLLAGYTRLLSDVNSCTRGMRSLTASSAADALRVYAELTPHLAYEDDRIEGALEGFHGEAFFFLFTDRRPVAADDRCFITCLDASGHGSYYLVKAVKPTFTILLEE